MYSCTIFFESKKQDINNLKKIFSSEKKVSEKRANFKILHDSKGMKFLVEAKDAVALRAAANTVMKSLAIYEKVKGLKK